MESDFMELPGELDFAGDYDGSVADADYFDRFPVAANTQRGGGECLT